MFGYVLAEKPELKVKEYELYRATYCGLCRSMGKCTGQCSRMTLNYDFVFLALVRYAIKPCEVKFKPRRCLAHPLEKRDNMERNDIIDYCSQASAILNYQKILDDLNDESASFLYTSSILFLSIEQLPPSRESARLESESIISGAPLIYV